MQSFLVYATYYCAKIKVKSFKRYAASKNVGGYRNFRFSPDIDMLEVRNNGTVWAMN